MKNRIIILLLMLLSIGMILVGCKKDTNNSIKNTISNNTDTSNNTTSNNTISVSGNSSSDEVITQLFIGYLDVSKAEISNCFYSDLSINQEKSSDAFKDALNMAKNNSIYNIDKIIIYSIDMDNKSLKSIGYTNVDAIKSSKVIVPITKVIDGETFSVNLKYEIYTVQINNHWYIANVLKTDEEVIEQLTHSDPALS